MPEGKAEVLEEYFAHEDILTLVKSIYDLLHEARFWFK